MNAIYTKNLTKSYGKSRGIIDVNLGIEEGEYFGFIGPNGAGKSTTIRTLLGLIKPDYGVASIFGINIRNNQKAIMCNIGYLPSEAHFYNGQKVIDVLNLSAGLHHTNCKTERDKLCERLNLDVTRKINDLSFGNKKKVAIVAALQHSPKLIILDEPTSGLDPLMQHEFFDILRDYNKSGSTIFMSSHILSEIQNNCTRAAIIREGRIIVNESIVSISHTQTKRIEIRGDFDTSKLQGIKDLVINGNTKHFLYDGSINELIKALYDANINDINITEPSLEEIFMHYYK